MMDGWMDAVAAGWLLLLGYLLTDCDCSSVYGMGGM
jgi:hypothetical protein